MMPIAFPEITHGDTDWIEKRIAECIARAYAEGHATGRREGQERMRERAAIMAEDYSKPFALHTNTGAMMFRATTEKLAARIRALTPEDPDGRGGGD